MGVHLKPKSTSPINLKEDIIVELALLHQYGIITTLPFRNYHSVMHNLRAKKPNGELQLLIDLRKISKFILDDNINKKDPFSTLTDAAQLMLVTGKNLFCKLDCSQAYQGLQMADQISLEMLAFNFTSRTFA